MSTRKQRITATALLCAVAIATAAAAQSADPLPSWNDGKSKQSIMDFVGKVTTAGSPDFVAPAERIATFDNDGTLWAEQPLYFQFFSRSTASRSLRHSTRSGRRKIRSSPSSRVICRRRSRVARRSLLEIMAAASANMTTEEFDVVVNDWLATAKHPRTGRLYTEMVYQPMIELLAYLRANGFKTFIVSGGGVDFMRGFAERVYGIPPEQVVGSTGKLKFEMRDGKPVLIKLPALDFFDDKEASRSPSKPTSAAGRSRRSAIPTAICRCCSGPPPGEARGSASSCATPTPNGSGPMTYRRWVGWNRAWLTPARRAGQSWT